MIASRCAIRKRVRRISHLLLVLSRIIMDALLGLATAAAQMEESARNSDEDKASDAPTARASPRKTRPTRTAYQKAVMLRCEFRPMRICAHQGPLPADTDGNAPPNMPTPRVITDYEYNKLPDAKERAALGQAIGLSARAVQVWFQNRRQRQKPSNEKAVTQWVEMDESKRLINQGIGAVGATPSQADVMGADAMPQHALSKSEAADAIVAAIQKQAATLSYSIPDHVQMERERALASAVAHAKAVHETGAAQERALGAASAPFLGETPTTEPRPLPDMSLGFTQPRMDAAQLLSLDAQSQQLELRAALLDAYAKRERAPTKNLCLPPITPTTHSRSTTAWMLTVCVCAFLQCLRRATRCPRCPRCPRCHRCHRCKRRCTRFHRSPTTVAPPPPRLRPPCSDY